MLRALKDIEPELREAARTLEMDLIEEYWGEKVSAENRIGEWLLRADAKYRGTPKPSAVLFKS